MICFAQEALSQNNYIEEPFSFTSDDLVLAGILTVPVSFTPNDKLMVLVAAPLPAQRDYHGMFSSLADTLSKNGIAVFRFDNRAYTDTTLRPDDVTVHEQADDVLKAIEALREDPRFAKSPIGLLGHSEGGSAVAIVASDNSDIAFVVCLGSSGIDGAELAYYQMTEAINGSFLNNMSAESKRIMFEMIEENIRIVAACTERDSVEYYMDNTLRDRYTSLDKKWFGKQTMEEAVSNNKKTWLKPRLMAYIRFKPRMYYSRISSPALIMWGKKDERMDYKSNAAAFRKIAAESKQQNFRIVVLDSLNHSFQLFDEQKDRMFNNPHRKKKEDEAPRKFSGMAWGRVVDWVTRLHL